MKKHVAPTTKEINLICAKNLKQEMWKGAPIMIITTKKVPK